MPYRRTPRVEAHLRASRDRILAAALALVAEQGYAGCSVAAVARRAGVATGSVYRHFPAKADLVAEVFRTASQREVDAFARAASLEESAAEGIATVIETFAGRALRAPRLAYALLAEPADPAVDAERLVFRRAYAAVIARIVARGVAAGELPPQDVGVSAAALVGAIGEALVGPLAAGAAVRDAAEPGARPPGPAVPNVGVPDTTPAGAAVPGSGAPGATSAGAAVPGTDAPGTTPAGAAGPDAPAAPYRPTASPPAAGSALPDAATPPEIAGPSEFPAPPEPTAPPVGGTITHLITFAQRSIGAVP